MIWFCLTGSDAAGITCVATRTPCGKFFEVSGTKKWITNGTSAHYFVTAVRTGGPGAQGVSLLLIERDDNVSTKLIKTRYGGAAGTAFVIFDKVKVPVTNLLGKENQGFKWYATWHLNTVFIFLYQIFYQIVFFC